jgi:hypothetical protein
MSDDRTTEKLDQNPILLGEMKLLRADLKKYEETLKKSDREMRLTRRSLFGFNRDLRTVEKKVDTTIGRVDVIEREVFPNGLPLEDIPNDASDDDLLVSPEEEAQDKQDEMAQLDRIAIDQSVKDALAPVISAQKILMHELHIDPIASEAAGQSVAPNGSKKTALSEVKSGSNRSLYATAALAVVLTLSQTGVFELIKKWLLHQP